MNERESRPFFMVRERDQTGVSGTGRVLDGIEFPNGKVAICWHTNNIAGSIGIYDSFEDFKAIHIDSHPTNGTQVVWTRSDETEKDRGDGGCQETDGSGI